MNRGDICWATATSTNARRLFCIVSREVAIPLLPTVLSVPITRRIEGWPSEVVLEKREGIPERCALNTDYIVPMPKELFSPAVARLTVDELAGVCAAINKAAGCTPVTLPV